MDVRVRTMCLKRRRTRSAGPAISGCSATTACSAVSTVATDAERLLGTVKPLLMVTESPYGVAYDPGWRKRAGAAKTKRT